MPELVPVRVRDCACPDSPHEEGDIVFLRKTLPLTGGIVAEQQLVELSGGDTKLLTAAWLDTFVRYGAVGWNLVDAEGDEVVFDVGAILDDWLLARPVSERASELYADSVMAPFQQAPPRPSPSGRIRPTTSPRRPPTRSSVA